ncbi:hypothetical protein L6452_32109 [Arctium lappa]|uniref:Uncharacterized protein n=1 Tax=Arctium lappa TaxID=4217 RepID=A0ACB8Z4S5_ARCLA|nr:hypothetical protein L6452_32109 [Arctium lappa]
MMCSYHQCKLQNLLKAFCTPDTIAKFQMSRSGRAVIGEESLSCRRKEHRLKKCRHHQTRQVLLQWLWIINVFTALFSHSLNLKLISPNTGGRPMIFATDTNDDAPIQYVLASGLLNFGL